MRTLLAALSLAAALLPATARADEGGRVPTFAMPVSVPYMDGHDAAYGAYATPAFGTAGALFVADLARGGRRGGDAALAVELAAGLACSAWSGFLLADAVELEVNDAMPISSFTTGAALALNLRVTTLAAMRLFAADERALAAVPTITIVPREGGAIASLRWTL